jgi:hypothetical protein
MMSFRLIGRWHALALCCLLGSLQSYAAAQNLNTSLLGGWVYVDRNNDGILAFADAPKPEIALPNIEVKLFSVTGGIESLLSTTVTDTFGRYYFEHLAAGTYTIKQTQPVDFIDGKDTLGELRSLIQNQPVPNNANAGAVGENVFSNIVLPVNVEGNFYNFGELGMTAAAATKRYLLGSTPLMPSAPPPTETFIPEPASAVLLLTSFAGLLGYRRRSFQRRSFQRRRAA